jgi:antitoxin VapB
VSISVFGIMQDENIKKKIIFLQKSKGRNMNKTKVFKSGNSMAVRLPKEFQFLNEEVEIFKRDDEIIIRNIPKNLGKAYQILQSFPDDFFPKGAQDREENFPQEREEGLE